MNTTYNNTSFKTGIELSELCSTMIQSLLGGTMSWDINRQLNLSLFCNRLITQIDIPAPVVYMRYIPCFICCHDYKQIN
jgi:CHASE2 domain-containing sensor protein